MGAKDAATVPDEHERQGQAYSTGDREQSSLLRSRRMVPKIAYAKNQIKYVIASIAIIAANLKEWFIGHVSSIFVVADRRYYELLFRSVLIGALLSLVKFADALINSSEIVRRLVMGRQHIEGEWIDTVFLRGEPVGFAVIMISFDGEKYLITGQDYDMSLDFAGGFYTVYSTFKDLRLEYVHVSQIPDREAGDIKDHKGTCEYQFRRTASGPPKRFVGQFHLDGQDIAFKVSGERVDHFLRRAKQRSVSGEERSRVAALRRDASRRRLLKIYLEQADWERPGADGIWGPPNPYPRSLD